MEIILNGRCMATVKGESIRRGSDDPDEFVLVGDYFQFRMSHAERIHLTNILDEYEDEREGNDEDDDWDKEDDLDKTYRRDMIEHRLHENATAAMRELLKVACTREDRLVRPKKEAYTAVAVDAYAMAHAMQKAFEQTQGGFTEARDAWPDPPASETEAAVAHRETDVFVVMTKLGPFPIERDWLEEKKALYPTLDVYHEVRQACDKLNELSRIANGVAALLYLERCLMALDI